ncbi:MAG: methyltransferase domain-containing protein [Gemmatimonadaceae bacterium]
MPWQWTPPPPRRRGVEILDDPGTDDSVRARSMADVVRANTLFGGTRAVLAAVRHLMPRLPTTALLLDVGTGSGDIPDRLRAEARRHGKDLTIIGADLCPALLQANRERFSAAVAADVTRLPVRDGAATLVVCSQLLHHFAEREARAVIAELHRASRGWVVIADLRRSRLAAAGFWTASRLLRFHPVTQHDGVTSVFRGFTMQELATLVRGVTGITPHVRGGVFWRLTATWEKGPR